MFILGWVETRFSMVFKPVAPLEGKSTPDIYIYIFIIYIYLFIYIYIYLLYIYILLLLLLYIIYIYLLFNIYIYIHILRSVQLSFWLVTCGKLFCTKQTMKPDPGVQMMIPMVLPWFLFPIHFYDDYPWFISDCPRQFSHQKITIPMKISRDYWQTSRG